MKNQIEIEKKYQELKKSYLEGRLKDIEFKATKLLVDWILEKEKVKGLIIKANNCEEKGKCGICVEEYTPRVLFDVFKQEEYADPDDQKGFIELAICHKCKKEHAPELLEMLERFELKLEEEVPF